MMCSTLLGVETWLLTEDGSQFQHRGEQGSGEGRRAGSAAEHDRSETHGVGDAGRKA